MVWAIVRVRCGHYRASCAVEVLRVALPYRRSNESDLDLTGAAENARVLERAISGDAARQGRRNMVPAIDGRISLMTPKGVRKTQKQTPVTPT